MKRKMIDDGVYYRDFNMWVRNDLNSGLCVRIINKIIPHIDKDTKYNVRFYNFKPRGEHYSALMQINPSNRCIVAWRRAGTRRKWYEISHPHLNKNLRKLFKKGDLKSDDGVQLYFKIKPIK